MMCNLVMINVLLSEEKQGCCPTFSSEDVLQQKQSCMSSFRITGLGQTLRVDAKQP